MLTNFLHALVQSWDSASGQMAPVPPTVWLSKGDCDVYVCVCARAYLSVCPSLYQFVSETEREMYVWITAGTHFMSLNDFPSFDCPQYSLKLFEVFFF